MCKNEKQIYAIKNLIGEKKIFETKFYLPKRNDNYSTAEHFAPINIALIKYWGKRDEELKLPMSSSFSITLPKFGSKTQILLSNNINKDVVVLNDAIVQDDTLFYKKIVSFLKLFKTIFDDKNNYIIKTYNNIPTASGLASSASGFAVLTLAINELYNISLSKKELSIIARIGSGSASRSVFGVEEKNKFVIWHKGIYADGMDSFAEPVYNLPDFFYTLKVDIIEVSNEQKSISSTEAMKITTQKMNEKYKLWLKQTEKDIKNIFTITTFEDLGQMIERNALMMHDAIRQVGIDYFKPKTLEIINDIQKRRQQGEKIYFTIDAGANVKTIKQ